MATSPVIVTNQVVHVDEAVDQSETTKTPWWRLIVWSATLACLFWGLMVGHLIVALVANEQPSLELIAVCGFSSVVFAVLALRE